MQKNSVKHGFVRANLSFISQFLRNPKQIGSIIPSSPLLGKAMASFVPQKEGRFVVELGPGTGPVTKSLLGSGIEPNNLFCLEMSPRLVKHLNKRFPGLKVIEGDACQLNSLLNTRAGKVDAIVSCLPLKSIPKPIVEKIIEQISLSLADDGVLIQFTYDLRPSKSAYLEKFTRIKSKIVVGNIPPARVDVFKKK